ncbi:F-box/kelch-repeat protein At3g06240-like [Setaria viridis]|uniref:F-box/kelch-repeat protein At3g06240-like n=1 Tax=Setaria viridis TaxID=4556 RepID=UPI003B3A810B
MAMKSSSPSKTLPWWKVPARLVTPSGNGAAPESLFHTPEALYEILLRLPAKDLCRLRAVCQTWRSLLSDPRFTAAHGARHPLIVTGYDTSLSHTEHPNEDIICDIVDLSGRVVKRVPSAHLVGRVMSIQPDLVCIGEGMREGYKLCNPVTGDVYPLPEGFAKEHANKRDIIGYKVFLSFGKVSSTDEC